MGIFDKLLGKTDSTAVEVCPIDKGVLVVMVKRHDTGKPVQGATATITAGPTPGAGTTSKVGTATFNARDPGAYTVNVPLTGVLADHRMVDATTSGSVSRGQTTILPISVAPTGHLSVEVVDPKKQIIVEDLDISVGGPEAASQVVARGSHRFGPLVAGKYTVSVTVRGRGHYEQRIVSAANIVVPAGGVGTAKLVLTPLLNKVTPRIEMEYRVVLLDRGLSAHQAGPGVETPIRADNVTDLELSLKQTVPSIGYKGRATFSVTPANVEVYTDAACTQLLAGKIENAQLLPGPMRLYLKSKTAGKFNAKLELDPPNDPFVEVTGPVTEEMGVVELKMKLHQHDLGAIRAMADINPDVSPYKEYYKALKNAKLPDQKVMTDAQKIGTGRLLHVQDAGHHGRARLIIEKLDAAQWPGGTDDYQIALTMHTGSGIKLFDKEQAGSEVPMKPLKKVKDLKAKELEVWVEASTASAALRDQVLSLGLDRGSSPAPHLSSHTPKAKGDFVRLTVVKVDKVEVDSPTVVGTANPWDDAAKRFYINFQDDNAGHDGRKVKIKAKLSVAIPGIKLHFMLAAHEHNMEKANWGVDKPRTWKWKDVGEALKVIDKPDRKKLLHKDKDTDAQGEAVQELVLSRFGGDKYIPGVYIDQDPHLAKYMPADKELVKRKPTLAASPIEVWRKFWYQRIKVTGTAPTAFAGASGQYTDCKATMEDGGDIDIPKATAQGFVGTAIYPKHMFQPDGTGGGDSVVVTDSNKPSFFAVFAAEAAKPLKIPITVCDVFTRPDGATAARNVNWTAPAAFPVTINVDKAVVSPPVQGGNVVTGGTWKSVRMVGATAHDEQTGNLSDAEISLLATRTATNEVTIALPAGVPGNATHVAILGLTMASPRMGLLGGFNRGDQTTVVVYDPTQEVDFQNTVAHEVGHSLFLAAKHITGIPVDHPNWYFQSGNHCNYQTNKCVMFESGPTPGSLNKFCPVCHPYVLVSNLFRLKANADPTNNDR